MSFFLIFPLPAFADELAEYKPGWYAKFNYTIPAGVSWYCDSLESDCIATPHPYPAENKQGIMNISEWDIGISARILEKSAKLCKVGIFDFRQGKIGEVEAFRSWDEKNLNSCTILEKKPCDIEGFVPCIASKISSRFPFDIIFNLPSSQITCPKVKFFGSEFDICFIYEAMRLMKYPIAAALIIKLFLYL